MLFYHNVLAHRHQDAGDIGSAAPSLEIISIYNRIVPAKNRQIP